jgi:hypothetical protein
MEIFGGFMVMMSILSFFMAAVWLVMPFVVFAIKGKLDRTLELLEKVENRMSGIELQLVEIKNSTINNAAVAAQKQQLDVPAAD